MTTLVALSGEHRVGVIVRERAGRLTLVYDEAFFEEASARLHRSTSPSRDYGSGSDGWVILLRTSCTIAAALR